MPHPERAADAAPAMAEDLRQVLALVAGVRVPVRRTRRWVDELLEGQGLPQHEAAVYLLATHYLALADRPAFDGLAWSWLRARGLGRTPVIRVRSTTDALRLAVFAVESRWPSFLVRRLVTILAQSRSTPVWVSLPDVARTGGRHASRLRPLVEAVDPAVPTGPHRRALLLALSGVHEVHRMVVDVGADWAIVANTAPDCRALTLFTHHVGVSDRLRARVDATAERLRLLTAVHSHDAGVDELARYGDARLVVPLSTPSTYPDDHLSAVEHVHQSPVAANHPGLLGLDGERVLDVFRTGSAVIDDGRWWLLGPAAVQPPPARPAGGLPAGAPRAGR